MALTPAERSRRYRLRQKAKRDAERSDAPAKPPTMHAGALARFDTARAGEMEMRELRRLQVAAAEGELVDRGKYRARFEAPERRPEPSRRAAGKDRDALRSAADGRTDCRDP